MRGKTAKKLKRFVKILIQNTEENERGTKTEEELYEEMKELWYSQGKRGQRFVDFVTKQEFK